MSGQRYDIGDGRIQTGRAPVVLSGALDLTANATVISPFTFLAPERMELKRAYVSVTTDPTATGTNLQLGIVGDPDEIYTGGWLLKGTTINDLMFQVTPTDRFVEKNEVFIATVTGTATTAGAGYMTVMFHPADAV